MAAGKKGMKGFEICPHTCTTAGCSNPATSTPLWRKEGSSCLRHARTDGKHPKCYPECPGHLALNRLASIHRPSRSATQAELYQYVPLIRKLPKFTDDELMAYLLDISVEDLHQTYGGSFAHSDPGSPSDMEMETDMGDVDMEDAEKPTEWIEGDAGSGSGNESGHDSECESDIGMVDVRVDVERDYTTAGGRLCPRQQSEQSSVSTSSLLPDYPTTAVVTEPSNVLQTFKVLYVPDPSIARLGLWNTDDLSYAERTISQTLYSTLKNKIPQHVFQRLGRGNSDSDSMVVKVKIAEWLWIMARLSVLHKSGVKYFEVSYMAWKDFKELVTYGTELQAAELLQYQCVLGGIDYTTDFRRLPQLYGWQDDQQFQTYQKRLNGYMLHGILVWPPPKQLERAGRKDPDCMVLDVTAVLMHSLRPSTILLDLENIDDDSILSDTVLKRSNSDCGKHVIFPDERRKRRVAYLREHSPKGEMWLMQDYVPTLKSVGEWRTFIVHGAIVHVVHTYKHAKGWDAKLASTMWSLQEIKIRLTQSGPPPHASEFGVADWGSHEERERAWDEFKAFALGVWERLVRMEKAIVSGTPCTALFCRLDIGVMMEGDRISYFVNEVERSMTTSLWMAGMPNGLHGVLADTFGLALHGWIRGARDPRHL